MNSHTPYASGCGHTQAISKVTAMLISGLLISLTVNTANAQTKPSDPPATTQQTPASAPKAKPIKSDPTGRAGRSFTPGWSMMSAEEREEHRERMGKITSYDDCKVYLQQHHDKMVERAKEQGGKRLGKPWRDACGSLKKK
jgi:hypothetical protein